MKKLMIVAAAAVATAGAFAETEAYNLTFNVKQLVPQYNKSGEVDYMKQGSVKYTGLQVDADVYAWDKTDFYADATFNSDELTFGKKDEKVAVNAEFSPDGVNFFCVGFGTEKSVSGSFVTDDLGYGTWSKKINKSVAKKLDEDPTLGLTDLVKLPKAVQESVKEWEELQDAITSQLQAANSLEKLAERAAELVTLKEFDFVSATNKLAEVNKEIKGLEDDLVAYNEKHADMTALIINSAENYELDTTAVDEALTAYENAKENADNYYEGEVKPAEEWLEFLKTHEALDTEFGGDEYARGEEVKKVEKELEELNKHYQGFKDGVASYEAEWKKEVAATNDFYAYMTELAGFAVDAEKAEQTAAKQAEAAQKAFEKEVASREKQIADYDAVNTEKILAPADQTAFFKSFGARKAIMAEIDGFSETDVKNYDVDFYEEYGYWNNYEVGTWTVSGLLGAEGLLAKAKALVADVKAAQETLAKSTSTDKETLEKVLVSDIKNDFWWFFE